MNDFLSKSIEIAQKLLKANEKLINSPLYKQALQINASPLNIEMIAMQEKLMSSKNYINSLYGAINQDLEENENSNFSKEIKETKKKEIINTGLEELSIYKETLKDKKDFFESSEKFEFLNKKRVEKGEEWVKKFLDSVVNNREFKENIDLQIKNTQYYENKLKELLEENEELKKIKINSEEKERNLQEARSKGGRIKGLNSQDYANAFILINDLLKNIDSIEKLELNFKNSKFKQKVITEYNLFRNVKKAKAVEKRTAIKHIKQAIKNRSKN